MIKYCVEQNPPHHLCFHWQCEYDDYNVSKKFDERKRNKYINGTEEASDFLISTNNESVVPTTLTKLPYFLRRGTLPLSGIDMRNTDHEDRVLDPIRQFALITVPNYYLLCVTIITILSSIDF
ncbi:hypothetical protein LOAG_09810 [Loa loa]|uniref:Tyrosine-protein phosphatase domain-containing protein n=1 Tax=Loa loa TaxID=7209 RepID=A0A1I7VDE4_LOALO|nr:hypothetical protein LOAG_09810 [Loa loa]EFO18684.2 hypothetical protein LOAG_09810 [Loa loa]